MGTSSRAHSGSMERWNDRIVPTKLNSTSCSITRVMSTWRSVLPNGSSITTCIGLTRPTRDEPTSRSYTRNSQAKRVQVGAKRKNVKNTKMNVR